MARGTIILLCALDFEDVQFECVLVLNMFSLCVFLFGHLDRSCIDQVQLELLLLQGLNKGGHPFTSTVLRVPRNLHFGEDPNQSINNAHVEAFHFSGKCLLAILSLVIV